MHHPYPPMIDLVRYFKYFDSGSPHHLAAVHELARHIPKDQLRSDADWVTMYHERVNELNELKEQAP